MKLRLYAEPPRNAVEREPPTDVTSSCARCGLREGVKTVCMSPEGDPGGLLIVSDYPGREEDARGRPMVGETGRYIRRLIGQWWSGPVAWDNALKCSPGSRKPTEKHVDSCRTYLSAVVREVKPTRVLIMGAVAAQAMLGRSVAPFGTRRGHAWLNGEVPAFIMPNPVVALRNRFVRKWLEEDLRWALSCALEPPPWKNLIAWTVDNARSAREAVEDLEQYEWSTFDVETAGAHFDPSFRILCLAACGKKSNEAWVWTDEGLADDEARRLLSDWLAGSQHKKVGQNLKFDIQSWFAKFGLFPSGFHGDTRLWRKLLEPEAPGKLAALAELVGLGGHKQEMDEALQDARSRVSRRLQAERKEAKARTLPLFDTFEPVHAGIDAELDKFIRACPDEYERWAYALVPKKTLYVYNGRDAVTTARFAEWIEPQLEAEPDLKRVWDKLTGPATDAVARVEAWGVAASRSALDAFDAYLEQEQCRIQSKLDTYATGINWDSNPQIAELLFKKLGLQSTILTDTGQPATHEKALDALKHVHPLPAVILDHRSIAKMRGTYSCSGMLPHIRCDGRIHPNIRLDGARSGRTSCEDPNLQNIPRAKDSPEGKMARDVFVASPGCTLVQFDYKTLELRVAAMLSGDPDMLAIFLAGVDYHQRTAELISKQAWNIPPEKVESKHRTQAKTINFALLYGMGDAALAAKIGSSMAEAGRVREAILGKFKGLAAWLDKQVHEVRMTGSCRTWWDGQLARRRPLHGIADQDDAKRSNAENGAKNTPVQGTASDFCIASLVACVDWLREDAVPAKLVLPVHDSLLFDVRDGAVEEVIAQVPRIMCGWNSGGVPLEVDVEVGPSWGSLKKVA